MSSPAPSSLDQRQVLPRDRTEHDSDNDNRARDLLHVATILNSSHNAAVAAGQQQHNPPSANLTSDSAPFQFRSETIAPSPEPGASPAPATSREQAADKSSRHHHHHGASAAPLRIYTDINPTTPLRNRGLGADHPALQHKTSSSSLHPISRTPSVRAAFSRALGGASGASSTVPSPIITAMGDVTPLPSPLLSGDSPGPWRSLDRPSSREAMAAFAANLSPTRDRMSGGDSMAAAMAQQKQRKPYGNLNHDGPGEPHEEKTRHGRNRSVSEYVPDPMHAPKRMVTVSGSHPKLEKIESPYQPQLRREPHLSEARGLTPIEKPPTPPPSESSLSANESFSIPESTTKKPKAVRKSKYEYFDAYDRNDNKLRRWRAIKSLGQGTFSRVMLATSQVSPPPSESDSDAPTKDGLIPIHDHYPRRTLVAVKICEHGPHGGASEDRVEMSLKRELQIMQCIHHPCLVHLKAWNIEPTRAILVMSYCPGGDLFDVASKHRSLLTPSLVRRIFAEIVEAVGYLHERRIVHRDIKLENVLVNIPPEELAVSTKDRDWTTYPYPVISLADLGLSRRIADDEKLETRCGSDDYAAPEVIMGQAYDGRATDAWSLGVLLYALLESRLPFDPAPGVVGLDAAMQMRMRSRTSHRIARVEWRWIEYGVPEGGEGEGEHEADGRRFEKVGLSGARDVVEALLKRARSRWPLEKVREMEWVKGGINVEGGIRFREEDEGEEVV
ncbi:kinase-like domain-containing protein [Coniochaeta sp. 2T2.1]|nr:kinase-like domain-containing protein [Coniochaeta sp. 2T2.1]